MKAKIVECNHPAAWIELTPETSEESMQLLRLARNAKPDGIEISSSFGGNDVGTTIEFRLYQDKRVSIRNTERRDK